MAEKKGVLSVDRLKRRDFLKQAVCGAGVGFTLNRSRSSLIKAESRSVMTVTGPVSANQAGSMLPHEHVMSLFGADITENAVYDKNSLFREVIPYLKKLKQMGCGTLADCTTAYFGRKPELLREISQETGLRIITNTGYYAAANDRYVPKHAYQEKPERLADLWIKEWEQGIDGTGIRPGFIKIGVDDGPLSKIDSKIVRAAAITHASTGLVIAAHTGDNPGSVDQQLEILRKEGVDPSAWIWVHANKVKNTKDLLRFANQGAWIELDGISPETMEDHYSIIEEFRREDLEERILLSHDGNSFRYGDRPPKPYHYLYSDFIPFLLNREVDRELISRLTEENPAKAFAVQIRSI